MACQSCEAISIQGVACHETGCPDSWLQPGTDRPYLRKCRGWCGCDFEPEDRNQVICNDCLRDEFDEDLPPERGDDDE